MTTPSVPQLRTLGSTDLQLTPIGFGAWAIGGGNWEFAWGPQDDAESIAAIHRALDLGVNWIDTAAIYGLGHSEQVVGRALKSTSHRPLVFTKCSMRWRPDRSIYRSLRAASVREELEASLRRLQVETIDLYQIHWPNPEEELEEGRNPALHLGFNVCKSTTVLGLRAAEHLERVRSRYTGKERDTESGNDYFGARYYASSMGRWMSPDWSAKAEPVPYAKLDDPQSLNLYAYVMNNPMNRTDPDGHWCLFGYGTTCSKPAPPPTPKPPVPPSASLHTDMKGNKTTFTSTNVYGQTKTVQIGTRNKVARRSAPGADGPFSSPNIGQVGSPHGNTDEYGPKGAYINVNDPEKDANGNSRARQIHGGGSGLEDTQADHQGWVPTLGCTRGQNIDVINLGKAITETRHDPLENGAEIPYTRNNDPQ